MARVLQVIETLGLGGAERLLALTVRELKRSSHTNVVAHLLDEPRDWRPTIEDAGVAVESLGLPSPYAGLRAVAGIRSLVARWRIDVIHSHLYYPNFYAQFAGWLDGVPVISSLHNLELEPEILLDNPRFTAGKQRALALMARAAVGLARPTLVAVSEAVRASAIRRLGAHPDHVITIHNGIDLEQAHTAPDVRAARRTLGLPDAALVLACVGRLVALKGQRYLLEAMAAVHAAFPNAVLLLVGGGPQREELGRLAGMHGVAGAVRFLGTGTALVERTMAAADIFVAPSLSEGFGLVALEAMAMERACVASRTGGLTEIVEDGASGILVPPADAQALAAAILRLAREPDLRGRMGRRGRAIAEARFDIRDTARRFGELYDDVVARRAAKKG
jgi:glycosyltransferase involved in cell wall biosynthesis